jgi:cyclohexadienyl dehydratase
LHHLEALHAAIRRRGARSGEAPHRAPRPGLDCQGPARSGMEAGMLKKVLAPCCAMLLSSCGAERSLAAPGAAAGEGAASASAATAAPAERPRTSAEERGQAPPNGELRVGTSGDYAPFSVRDATGVHGFDADIALSLARDLGLELRWVAFRWPDLSRQLADGEFDVAMSGVTWQPSRAVTGYMTRAVARGGPCLLGDASAPRVAVNLGGVLEAWARSHLQGRELLTVSDNTSLPALLAAGRVGAIVTDSFELHAFARPGWDSHCEPALARKVYWVAPGRARELGSRIDAWLGAHGADVQAAQRRWFGAEQRVDAATDLVDLMARRFAFMPLVAELKARRGQPIEDREREREVVSAAATSARRLGLPERAVAELFGVLIELSKAVQLRQREPSTLDLGGQIRPALIEIGDRILTALARARAEGRLERLALADLELLSPWLTGPERERVLGALRAIG